MKYALKFAMLCVCVASCAHYSEKGCRILNVDKKESDIQYLYLQPIITQYFIDNKSEIWLLFLIAHSKR